MIEYEYKAVLSFEEYSCILEHLSNGASTVSQTNYYYDTDDFEMNRKRVTCRVREKNGKFTTMIKEHAPLGNSYSAEKVICVSDEREDMVFAHMGAKVQGSLRTERTTLYSDDYIKAMIDKNIYLGCTDYELEVEYKLGAEERATMYLQKAADIINQHIDTTAADSFFERMRSTKSKSERFFERKKFLIETQRDKFNQITTCPE